MGEGGRGVRKAYWGLEEARTLQPMGREWAEAWGRPEAIAGRAGIGFGVGRMGEVSSGPGFARGAGTAGVL